MNLGERLSSLRRERGYTQEQFAELMGVSRQAVSKWESGVAFPETEKLIKISELYHCSLDYLFTGKKEEEKERTVPFSFTRYLLDWRFERKSKKTVNGIPLWHVNIGFGRTAKGIVAVGLAAKGVVSVGLFSMGLLSLGVFSFGLLAFGVFALGLLAFAPIAVGIFAIGAVALGLFALGAVAIGEFSVGALAIGNYAALGDYAYAKVAVGKTHAEGIIYAVQTNSSPYDRAELCALLNHTAPAFFRPLSLLFGCFL